MLLQQSDVALTRSQPVTQHSHVHALHVHVPVSQHPQQSHVGQLALFTLTAYAPNGTTASDAHTNKLFMTQSPCQKEHKSDEPCRNTRHGNAHLLLHAVGQAEGGV